MDEKKQDQEVAATKIAEKSANVREHSKTASQRAEDMAYTINHALSCTATDFIDPYISTYSQKYLKQRISIGCGEDHSAGGSGSNWQNVVGEFVGDFGAVPFTVGVQHFAPWAMDGIRYVAEPLFGDVFRHGAKEAASHKMLQATLKGYPLSKEAYQHHARELYHYEMQHLPQGLTWTGSAIALNVALQKTVLGNPSPVGHILTGKVTGAVISAGLLFGFRSMATEDAKRWDHWATKHVFLPATKHVGRWFGVKEQDVQTLVDKQETLEAAANGHAPVATAPKEDTSTQAQPATHVSHVHQTGRAQEADQSIAVAG